jgi:hypothetical protein
MLSQWSNRPHGRENLVGISAAITLSILLNVTNINDLKGVNCVNVGGDSRIAISRVPDEVHHLFQTYEEGVDAKGIRERLHLLAVFLKGNPDFEGFIVSYAGQRACRGEAAKRARIAKQFLASQEKVLSKQLKSIDAGYRKRWVVELWYGPMRAKTDPPPLDTIDRSEVQIVRKCSDISSLHVYGGAKKSELLRFMLRNLTKSDLNRLVSYRECVHRATDFMTALWLSHAGK